MTKAAADPFDNPGSNDELVRDLEDSGYPVDSATEGFIRPSDSPSGETDKLVSAPAQLHSARKRCATPEDKSTGGGDAAE